MRTISQVIGTLPRPSIYRLEKPSYISHSLPECNVGLAVESMKRHTTDEGWQLFQGLECTGYRLIGHGLYYNFTHVPAILQFFTPSTLILQDKREWDGLTAGGQRTFNRMERFADVDILKSRPDIFKVTVLKDAQNDSAYHRQSAEEIGCHAWIIYYHPDIVCHLAPYVRREHLVRTYHSVDTTLTDNALATHGGSRRDACLLSGAISNAYPIRQMIRALHFKFQRTDIMPHPGYGRNQCHTPAYLNALCQYKVAICTSSVYGYTLRKIIEATACGCRVITDLPVDEVLPKIDGNLVRIDSTITATELNNLVQCMIDGYDPMLQEQFSRAAKWYDYREVGKRLAADIETMRRTYNG